MGFKAGTGFGELYGSVTVYLIDRSGNIILCSATTGNTPSAAAGYAIGCILINETTGVPYYNSGTASSCTFSSTV